jgi:PAS domain S-box-containing protein
MPEFLNDLFSTDGLMPHGHCYLWRPALVWLHVVSDALTTLAYTSIPFTLLYFVRKRRDMRFNWMVLAFAVFIIACGATHALEIWTLWTPVYWLSGVVKAITAVASAITAVLLIRLMPAALAFPTAQQLATARDSLRDVHDALEQRVEERTRELTRINSELAVQIEERKRVELALSRSERQYRMLVNSGVIGVVRTSSRGQIYEANPAMLQMIGYTAEDVESGRLRWTELTPAEYHPVDQIAVQRLRATGAAPVWEKEYLRKDGTRVPVLVGVAALDQATGENLAFVLDLTERKRAEDAVRRMAVQRDADAKLAALLEAAPDAMVIVNPQGQIVVVNAEAERLFGHARAELLGRSLDCLVPAQLNAANHAQLADYVRHPLQRRVMGSGPELVAVRKDGSEFPAEISLGPVQTDDGVLISTAIRDVTARKQAELVLRRAKEDAEAASSELEAFSYSVAHDLRSPLRAMNGYSAALLEDYNDRLGAEAAGYLERIAAGARRMDEIIDALLSLSQLTRSETRSAEVDLAHLGRAVIEHLQANDPGRTVTFTVQDPLVVEGDPRLLRVLLDNLLGNAWKFTSKHATAHIELGCEQVDGTRVYYVRDNGVGFDMAYAAKLFTPFGRLHTHAEFAGTGIGLATVHRIVRRHGGRLWAQSAEHQGATFRFTLPSDPSGASQ